MKKIIIMWILLTLLGIDSTVQAQTVDLIQSYPAADHLFTQGFEKISEDQVAYSTGLYGESRVGIYHLKDQRFDTITELPAEEFGEGLTLTEDALWHFTWREGIAYKRPLEDLSSAETFSYEGDGWGMAYDFDQKVIWTSDGSDRLTKRNPETFEEIDSIRVKNADQYIHHINELEYANQSLYANIWLTNEIIRIDVETGQVINQWDLTDLVNTLTFEEENVNRVLNGIAHVKEDVFYITGKLYPVIWEVELIN